MRRLIAIALITPIVFGCAAHRCAGPVPEIRSLASTDAAPRDLPVESYALVEVEEANSLAASAAEAGEQWSFDAIEVALRFVGAASGRYVSIEKIDESGESPTATTVTIITGSYLDDSVWGVWNQLLLSRGDDGRWRIDEARRAWRCYRGHQTDSFGDRWCP